MWGNFFPLEKFLYVCDGGVEYLRRAGGIFNYLYFEYKVENLRGILNFIA